MKTVAAIVLLVLLTGCPSGARREVNYQVKEMTPEERAARQARMHGNIHQRDQLFEHVQQIRRPRH